MGTEEKPIVKLLGKITDARIGHGGYQDSQLGLYVSFQVGESQGIADFKGAWDAEQTPHRPECSWTEEDRSAKYAETFRFISKLLSQAKKRYVHELVGVPVELTFRGSMFGPFESWRILEEVL